MNPILEKYLNLLWGMFEYDINVLSQPWIYYWLLVPAFCYLVFFFVKWTVLTAPLWLPFAIVFNSLFGRSGKKSKSNC